MCGIVGLVDQKKNINENILEQMTRALIHRGPDDEGYHIDRNIGLGHRRLSIIDLSQNAKQPMTNEDQLIWIVFNGEFYNFQEYKQILLDNNHKLISNSDTEIIVHLYEEYGIEKTLSLMNGMFTFGILDKKKQKIFLTRDRLGIKPCYYYFKDDIFAFCSEIKPLFYIPGFEKKISIKSLAESFTYGYIPEPNSVFDQVYKLEPGTYLEYDIKSNHYKLVRYWDVSPQNQSNLSENEYLDKLDFLLKDAVKLRLISDVPLGVFLSGGIDSTLITAYMSELNDNKPNTFSIGFEHAEFDELDWAKQAATKLKTEHHEKIVKINEFDILKKLVYYYDEPFYDDSNIPTYYVSETARKNITVVLSGDGGDETFFGYSRYNEITSSQSPVASNLWLKLVKMFYLVYPATVKGKNFLRRKSNTVFQEYSDKMKMMLDHYINKLFSGSVDFNNRLLLDYLEKYKDFGDNSFALADLKTYLPMDILTKVDRASMAVSLETRVPFLDHRLVEFSANVPIHFKYKNRITKYLLKKLLKEKFQFNQEFINRPKKGFAPPIVHWFQTDAYGAICDLLLTNKSYCREFFNQHFIRKLLNEHYQNYRQHTFVIWSLIFFEHWAQNWLGDK